MRRIEEENEFSPQQYLHKEELKEYEAAYTEIVQQLETELENKLANKVQLLIGIYKASFTELTNSMNIFEKKWRTVLLYKLLDDLAAQPDLGQIEIAKDARQHVLNIITQLSKMPSPKRTKNIKKVIYASILICLLGQCCFRIPKPKVDENDNFKLNIADSLLILVLILIFMDFSIVVKEHYNSLDSLRNNQEIKKALSLLATNTEKLSQTVPSFILGSLIDQKFEEDYQRMITDFNQQAVMKSLQVDMKFVHIFKAIQRVCSENWEGGKCPVCQYDCQLSEAVYSVVEIKSSKNWPYQGFYHQNCFKEWIDTRNHNKNNLIDILVTNGLVFKFGFPLLISIQKVRDDFSNLQRRYPLKPGYELTLTDQNLSLEQKLQEFRRRPCIINDSSAITKLTENPVLNFNIL